VLFSGLEFVEYLLCDIDPTYCKHWLYTVHTLKLNGKLLLHDYSFKIKVEDVFITIG